MKVLKIIGFILFVLLMFTPIVLLIFYDVDFPIIVFLDYVLGFATGKLARYLFFK